MFLKISSPISFPLLDFKKIMLIQPFPIRVISILEDKKEHEEKSFFISHDLKSILKEEFLDKISGMSPKVNDEYKLEITLNKDLSDVIKYFSEEKLSIIIRLSTALCLHVLIKSIQKEKIDFFSLKRNDLLLKKFLDGMIKEWFHDEKSDWIKPTLWASILGSTNSFPMIYINDSEKMVLIKNPSCFPQKMVFIEDKSKEEAVFQRHKYYYLGAVKNISKFEEFKNSFKLKFQLAESLRTEPNDEKIFQDIALNLSESFVSGNSDNISHLFYLANCFVNRMKLNYLFESKEEELAITKTIVSSKKSSFCYIFKNEWDLQNTKIKGNFSRLFDVNQGVEETKQEEAFYDYGEGKIIGYSKAVQEVFEFIDMIAPESENVLITGESGTGKEIVARAIHYQGPRKREPFIPVICSAIPLELFPSEFFGIEQEVATGVSMRKGLFERANKGTLFLDEIGDVPLDMQVQLLRIIEEKRFYRVGGDKLIKVNVRLITATNKNLEEEIKKGNFRNDLYYRLETLSIELPLLRNRKEDIPLLARYFLEEMNRKRKKKISGFSADAEEILRNYYWPSNVRGLKTEVVRAHIRTKGDVIEKDALSDRVKEGATYNHEYYLIKERLFKDKQLGRVNERLIEGFLFIKDRGEIKKEEYSVKFKISKRQTERDLNALMNTKLVGKYGKGDDSIFFVKEINES